MDDDHVRFDEWEDAVVSLNFPFAAASLLSQTGMRGVISHSINQPSISPVP